MLSSLPISVTRGQNSLSTSSVQASSVEKAFYHN
jgi:hypothetical protein